jgi:amino acid transporter
MSTSYPPDNGPDNGRVTDRADERLADRDDARLADRNDARHTAPVAGATAPTRSASDLGLDRGSVLAREEDRYGGIKIGSAFFGWLTATGMASILIALLSAGGAAVGLAKNVDVSTAAGQASAGTATAKTVGLVSGIALLVILFVAYYCGGYVAGRMARFNGTKQGLAVWLWAVLIAIVVAVLAAVAGSKFNVLAQLNLPRIPINEGTLSTGGIIAALAIVLVTLIGALLGGKAGMHFHRKVDKAGLGR